MEKNVTCERQGPSVERLLCFSPYAVNTPDFLAGVR
jgi:hypothetical protein